jgi:hypothetical protein
VPLWQKADQPLDPQSPEGRFGERFYKLLQDVSASVGVETDDWQDLSDIERWTFGHATIALIESLEDVEVVDRDFQQYPGVRSIEHHEF